MHAQQHTYQDNNDLISFSISPASLMASRATHTNAPPSNTSPGPHTSIPPSNTSPGLSEATTTEGQDLMKFSLSPEDLVKLQNQRPQTIPASYRSHDPRLKSHDVRGNTQGGRLPGNVSPKWDHFSSNSSQRRLPPNQAIPRGVATDTDHWTMLSINGTERVLSPDGMPLERGIDQASRERISSTV